MNTEPKHKKRLAIAVAFGVWLCAIVGAMAWIAHYSDTPGRSDDAPNRWPAQSQILLARTNPTLVMFAHPRCPCTSASIGELDLLMAQSQGRVSAHVVFLKPATMSEKWTESALWRKASAIPGVVTHIDEKGAEARRFGLLTSGDTLLYAPDGRLLFHGGITLSRGHSGDNPGRTAIAVFLQEGSATLSRTPAFGCSLFEDEGKSKRRL